MYCLKPGGIPLSLSARQAITVGGGGLPMQWHSAPGPLDTLGNLISSLSFSLRRKLFEANLENEGSVSGSDSTFYRQSEGKAAHGFTPMGGWRTGNARSSGPHCIGTTDGTLLLCVSISLGLFLLPSGVNPSSNS